MKKTGLSFILSSIIWLTVAFSFQQSQAQQSPHFNHITVYVVDLDKSSDFYEKVLLLKKIAEPFHDGRHNWYEIEDHGQLHIVKGAKEVSPHDINIHLSFSVRNDKSLEVFMKRLDDMHIKYGNWKGDSKSPEIRPDGVKQIYFQDPDGYWIEVNNDKF